MHQGGCRKQAINGRSPLARVEPPPLFRDPPIDADDSIREQIDHQDQLAFERGCSFRPAESQLLDSGPNLADYQNTYAEAIRLCRFIPRVYVPITLLALANF